MYQQKLMIIDDSIELFKVSGEFEAIRVFETILNKPFDYRGSLTYIINARKETEE